MAKEDAELSAIIYNFIIPVGLITVIIVVAVRKKHVWADRLFAFIYSTYIADPLEHELSRHKEELFAQLSKHESTDPNLRNKGLIRILEIGSGSGMNFRYYPKNCHLVCYDPNPHFRSYFFSNQQQFPDINFERLVVSGGENLVGTADGTIDVVVATLVLCTVENVDQVLLEINRVLASGGKFLFLEHVVAPKGSVARIVQNLITPIWKVVSRGCRLNRDPLLQMRSLNVFDNVEVKSLDVKLYRGFQYLAGYIIAGTATK